MSVDTVMAELCGSGAAWEWSCVGAVMTKCQYSSVVGQLKFKVELTWIDIDGGGGCIVRMRSEDRCQ